MPQDIYSDRYEVQKEIGSGAMGIVYKAVDNKATGSPVVALKVIHKHLANDVEYIERFLREARLMKGLEHDNIVKIFSVEQDHGIYFIVMEYVQCISLSTKIKPDVSFPLHEAMAITYQIAEALAYAHEHGIVHRDVKPANVLIDNENRIKLTDFGIAKALDEAPLTRAGKLIGNLRYMAPEQARDKVLDGRTDLYSLGLMFYEMLTGKHPRHGLTEQAIFGMLADEKNTPHLEFPPSVPVEVQAVVKDLLQHRSVDRIKDAHQLLRRLEPLQPFGNRVPSPTGNPNSATDDKTICEIGDTADTVPPNQGKPERLGKDGRRALLPLSILVSILVFIGAIYYFYPYPKSVADKAETDRAAADKAAEQRRSEESRNQALEASLDQLRRFISSKDLASLEKISIMSEDRRSILETLFANYSTIEASYGEIVATPTGFTTILRIDKLVLLNGEVIPPGSSLRKIEITVPREGDGWGKIKW